MNDYYYNSFKNIFDKRISMKVLDYIIDSYNIYKQKLLEAFILGVAIDVIDLMGLIPVMGWYLYAKLFPQMVVWYYNKLNIKVDPKYDVAFKSIIIPLSIAMIGVLIMIVGLILYFFMIKSTEFIEISIIVGIILGIVGFILYILLLYTLFGSIIGKVDKFKIYAKKSIYLFLISLIPGSIVSILSIIVSFIPFIGPLLDIILTIFYEPYIIVFYAIAIENIQS
jgi:hypothetical protein